MSMQSTEFGHTHMESKTRMDSETKNSPDRAMRRVCKAAAVGTFLLAALACTAPPAVLPPERVVGEVGAYVIGVPDVLQLRVWKQDQLSVEAVVRTDGKISMPLLQDVQAEGLTPEELREVLTERLSEFIVAPQVNVMVKAMNSNIASIVGGGVARSGVVPLQRHMRVLDAIATMGGFTTFAQKDDIRVLREIDGLQVEYRFDYDAFIRGSAPNSNMLLEPGDTIVVPD
ncbi:MAG: polysaccharide biosynthesis/export family protein [Myxococcota bacterium]|nr:polysaccharide biosynthesis/export family protein [Myxococcota bacterium]